MKLQAELIYVWKVSHFDLFWNRGTRKLGNGLLLTSVTSQPISICSKTKTKVIAWLLSTLNWKSLYLCESKNVPYKNVNIIVIIVIIIIIK